MRCLAMIFSLLGGCVLVPPPNHATPSAPSTATADAPATAPVTPPSESAEEPRAVRIKPAQSKVLLGMTLDEARAQLARWGYHGNLTILQQHIVNSNVASCDDTHVCEYEPTDFNADEDLVLVTRHPTKIGAPPPP